MSLSGQALQFAPVEGTGFSGVVARFTDTNPLAATSYNATITWGDGSQTPNAPVQLNNGAFEVSGMHLFGDEGNLPFNVSILRQAMPIQSLDMPEPLVVGDAPLAASGVAVPAQTEGVQFNNVVVAHFTDGNLSATLGDFSSGTGGAQINWGDGVTSAGAVTTHSGGGFDVVGSHTYTAHGNFAISVQINDKGGSTATANTTVQVNRPLADPITTTAVAPQNVVEGTAFANAVVATFTDTNVGLVNGLTHTATISWGDGTPPEAGTVTEPSAGNGFQGSVTGSHKYAEEGQFQITVSVSDNQNPTNTDGDFKAVTVADAPLNAQNTVPINNANNPLTLTVNNLLVASFTDQGGPEAVNNYTATINWGDGTPVGMGTVTLDANGTTFSVRGNHVYALPGKNFTITTTITDEGGMQAQAIAKPVVVGTQVERFIEQAYLDLLHRDVDPGALTFWRNFLTSPNAPPNARGLMVLAIEGTGEFRVKLIDSYFQKYLFRGADPNATNAFLNYLNAGGTFEAMKAIIIGSDEYFQKHGNNPNAFLNALFMDALGRQADPGAQQAFAPYSAGGSSKRTFLALAVVTSQEGLGFIVNGYYQQFVRRGADPGGKSHYVGLLQRGFRDEFVIADIVGSQEYLNRV